MNNNYNKVIILMHNLQGGEGAILCPMFSVSQYILVVNFKQ